MGPLQKFKGPLATKGAMRPLFETYTKHVGVNDEGQKKVSGIFNGSFLYKSCKRRSWLFFKGDFMKISFANPVL